TTFFNNVHRDFVFVGHTASTGLGRDFIRLEISGLLPGTYEFTGWNYDDSHSDAALKFAAWTDMNTLGGADGPAAWLDTNVGAGQSYQPTNQGTPGYKNPIPTLARTTMTGGWPSNFTTYTYASSFLVTSDGVNPVVLYTWADLDDYTGSQ